MKMIITQAENGWIVNVKSFGLSNLKEPYGQNIFVFMDLKDVMEFIKINSQKE